MLEIRFHGRGGQGTVVATILLAKAFFEAGYQVQSFPFFGIERRGAPVEAYLRLSKNDILIRTNVYNPDHVVVQDRTLIQSIDFARGLRSGGWILINSPAPPANLTPFAGFRLAFVDASHIARNHKLGTRTSPIVNTSMIGAFASILDMPPIESVVSAIREEITIEAERNVQAAKDAYREVRILGMIEQGLEK